MELSIIRPADDLAHLVRFYCLCDDITGEHAGLEIVTAPQLGLCLCLQLNDFVLTDFADPRPLMSISGVQPRLRRYVPEGAVRALVMFFTPLGSIRLAPNEGPTLYAEGFDSGSLFGDGAVLSLRQAASAAPDANAIGRETDAWLRRMFASRQTQRDHASLAEAARLLRGPATQVSAVAEAVGLSDRQLERSFRTHFGLSPKAYQVLDRVTRSLHAATTGQGDPLEGFADQAHQIRSWQNFLGFTPGQMRRRGPSELGTLYQQKSGPLAAGWAHYL